MRHPSTQMCITSLDYQNGKGRLESLPFSCTAPCILATEPYGPTQYTTTNFKKDTQMNILFLCTGNSCRSQMAEGWARHLKGDILEAYSAGVETHGMNSRAVAVMKEAGVDISKHQSKLIADLPSDIEFDYVVTVCNNAKENCPYFPAKSAIIHVGFDDPPTLTKDLTDEEEILATYRRVRDEIKAYISRLPHVLLDV